MALNRQRVSSGAPWETLYGYSRAVRVGDQVFVSGTTAMKDGVLVGICDAAEQTRQILRILEEALAEAGASKGDVVRLRVYLIDVADHEAVLLVVGEAFGDIRPANTLLVVAGLIDPRMLVEIEADAVVGSALDR